MVESVRECLIKFVVEGLEGDGLVDLCAELQVGVGLELQVCRLLEGLCVCLKLADVEGCGVGLEHV